jgi:hypothetical protein
MNPNTPERRHLLHDLAAFREALKQGGLLLKGGDQ